MYGTNRPESDEDFQGIFIPSKEDLLGLQNCPTEWSLNVKLSDTTQNQKGDVDRKFYSLKRFMHLAAEGQPGQLELFFVTPDTTVSYDPIWSKILDNIGLFLSKKSISPFIGFALSQAHRATIKGKNLRLIQAIITHFDAKHIPSRIKLSDLLDLSSTEDNIHYQLADEFEVKLVKNPEGFTLIEIGGRRWDINLKLKTFVANLKELEGKYGSRSRAAANHDYDYKSLMHAYRLMYEAEELLTTGKITFPLAPEKVIFLKSVRDGSCGDIDHWAQLNNAIDRLRKEIEPKSFLPEEPDYKGINKLCIEILSEHLEEK